jgi:DNA-binding XRE family transcriptional regulator
MIIPASPHRGAAFRGDRFASICFCPSGLATRKVGGFDDTGFFARIVTKRLQTIKRRMIVDRDVRTAYEALGDEFDLARELIAARVRAGLTQAEVAERMGTTQSVVARLESGARMPSVNTLLKFAKATRSRPIIKLLAA